MRPIIFLATLSWLVVLTAEANAQYYRRGYRYPYYYGYGPYYPYINPTAANLYGTARLVNAGGDLMIKTQQTYMMQEKVKQEKLVTRRKAIDEYLYEREVLPTPEEERERKRQEQLMRSRNDPPLTEIWSGKALNDLLLDLQRLEGRVAYAPSVVIDQEILKHINVNTGRMSGSIGVFDDEKLVWPLVLATKTYEPERKKIESLVPMAVSQAKAGAVQAETLIELNDAIKKMTDKLRENIASTPSTDYIRAKRYLNQLKEGADALQDPNVSKLFNQWRPKGDTVAELVRDMTNKGLRFAPATTGDEPYYTALHRAMANYDIALAQLAEGQYASAKPDSKSPGHSFFQSPVLREKTPEK
ncbi:MAG: hypothetical protein KatS3mg105_2457 [Gemmatales bacterium]|nr:MAG: hypothetical protein KatS3mg105_2457 [Gemmatales bacterium]